MFGTDADGHTACMFTVCMRTPFDDSRLYYVFGSMEEATDFIGGHRLPYLLHNLLSFTSIDVVENRDAVTLTHYSSWWPVEQREEYLLSL